MGSPQTIQIRRTVTPNNVPANGSLAQGELALNLADVPARRGQHQPALGKDGAVRPERPPRRPRSDHQPRGAGGQRWTRLGRDGDAADGQQHPLKPGAEAGCAVQEYLVEPEVVGDRVGGVRCHEQQRGAGDPHDHHPAAR